MRSLNCSIDRVAYRRLRNAPRLAPLIAAIGFSFILQNIGIYWQGSNAFSPPSIIPTKYVRYNILTSGLAWTPRFGFGRWTLPCSAVTIPLLIGLSWFVYRTRTGKAMRATAQDREAAALMGIDINRAIAIAFIIGGSSPALPA